MKPKQKERTIRNLNAGESRTVKENLNWAYFNRLFCSSFIRQIRKGNFDKKGAVGYASVIKETSPRQIWLQTYINTSVLGLSLYSLFSETEYTCTDTYYTRLYKALAPYILDDGGKLATSGFDTVFENLDAISGEVEEFVESVRQTKNNETAMSSLLSAPKDRIVLIAHILAFKSIILTEGYYYSPKSITEEVSQELTE
jgi:hypothetical protein